MSSGCAAAASDTRAKTIAAAPPHLGADIGFIAVLHTWGQTLGHHPHLHCVVPGGGISPDAANWISCPDDFFLPVRVLAHLFRGKLLAALQQSFAAGRLPFHGALSHLADPGRFAALCRQLRRKQWVVYAKPPFGGPEQVLKYLARYTHRVAIANSRITAADSDSVSFRYQDYAHGNRNCVMTLAAMEFPRRFLQHVLPARFVRMRHYGLLANRACKEKLPLCRLLIAHATGRNISPAPDLSACLEAPADAGERCPACHLGTMRRIQDFRSQPTWEYLRHLPRYPPTSQPTTWSDGGGATASNSTAARLRTARARRLRRQQRSPRHRRLVARGNGGARTGRGWPRRSAVRNLCSNKKNGKHLCTRQQPRMTRVT